MKLRNTEDPLLLLRELSQQHYHDMRLICSGGVHQLSVCRLVLAAASPVLKDALPDIDGDDVTPVMFVGYDPEVVYAMLVLIATGDCLPRDQVQRESIRDLLRNLRINIDDPHVPIEEDPAIVKEESVPHQPQMLSHAVFSEDDVKPVYDDNMLVPQVKLEQLDSVTDLDDIGDLVNFDDDFDDDEDDDDIGDFDDDSEDDDADSFIDDDDADVKVTRSNSYKRKTLRNKTKNGYTASYECTHCSHRTSGLWTLMKHMRKHIGDDATRCKFCQENIDDVFSWKEHKRMHDSSHVETFESAKCESKSKNAPSSEKRFTYQCLRCQKRLKAKGKWSLMLHMKKHFGDEASRCGVCKEMMSSFKDWKTHKKEHNSEVENFGPEAYAKVPIGDSMRFPCTHCDKVIHGEWQLTRHLATHIGEKAFECPVCKKITSKRASWFHHRNLHKNQQWVCDLCGKTLKTKSYLATHIRLIHKERDLRYKCDICHKEYPSKGGLRNHKMYVHENKRNHLCDICGFKARTKNYLKDHYLSHQKDKPFKCDMCDKGFIREYKLEKHRKEVHIRDERFPCTKCGKVFHTKALHQCHMKRVHGKDRYFCGLCNTAFKFYHDSDRHLITHTDLKPYVCLICNEGFKHIETGRRHSRVAHPGKKISVKFKMLKELQELKEKVVHKLNDADDETHENDIVMN